MPFRARFIQFQCRAISRFDEPFPYEHPPSNHGTRNSALDVPYATSVTGPDSAVTGRRSRQSPSAPQASGFSAPGGPWRASLIAALSHIRLVAWQVRQRSGLCVFWWDREESASFAVRDRMHLSLPAPVVGHTVPLCAFGVRKCRAEKRFDAGLPFATHKCHSGALCQPRAYGSDSFAEGDSRRGRAQTQAGKERAQRPTATLRVA
jgi:hypothetical protein